MNISDRGLTFIASYEGWEPNIYLDAAGLPTIGYGHLLKDGEEARFKNGITKEQGKALLKEDVKEAEDAVKRLSGVTLNQNQFDALVSFVFNVGQGRYRDSTLRKKVNAGDMNGAADEFLRWVRAGGKVLTGLQRRRAAERKMFLGG